MARPNSSTAPSPILAGILLAAGRSRRLGQPKQQVLLHQQTLLDRSANRLLDQADPVAVVINGQVQQHIDAKPAAVSLLVNEQPEQGLGSSIVRGIQWLSEHTPAVDAVLLMLVDQYRVDRKDLEQLVWQWQQDNQRVTAAAYENTLGPPVIFPSHWFAKLKRCGAPKGAKDLIYRARDSGQLTAVPMPSAAADLDTPDDLRALRDYESRF